MNFTLLSIILWLWLGGYEVDTNLSSMTIDGTSTLHDWTMQVEGIKTSGTISYNDDAYTTSGLTFTFPVKGLESGKDAMNENTWKAMNESKYPNVTFRLSSIEKETGDSYRAKGDLTITGTAKNISIPVTFKSLQGSKVLAKGSHTFKMSSFGVEPPEVMWGTITTGDQITVNFNIVLTPDRK